MGCDIHPAIEYKQDGVWKAVLFPNKYWGESWNEEPELVADLDINRDYNLFAILGNVRNGRGFAGCDTGDGFVPMTDDRGIPDDISEEALAALSDEHSATWVTLAEILAYDWTRTTKTRGWVSAVEFLDWDWMKDYQNNPKSWSGGVHGGGVVHISAEEMKSRVDAIRKDRHGRAEEVIADVQKEMGGVYAQIEWETPYADAAKQLWTKVLPTMLKLGAQHGFDNVRLVMDFDS